jgi:hypothetical protein
MAVLAGFQVLSQNSTSGTKERKMNVTKYNLMAHARFQKYRALAAMF